MNSEYRISEILSEYFFQAFPVIPLGSASWGTRSALKKGITDLTKHAFLLASAICAVAPSLEPPGSADETSIRVELASQTSRPSRAYCEIVSPFLVFPS